MRDEFDPTGAIGRIVDNNEFAGAAHAVLNLLVADSLFPGINHTEQDNVWQAVRAIDEVIGDRDRLLGAEYSLPGDRQNTKVPADVIS